METKLRSRDRPPPCKTDFGSRRLFHPPSFRTDAKSKWIAAHSNSVAGINTVGTCIELVDLFAEGSVNLVVADFGNILSMPRMQTKLKVFKG